MILHHFGSWSTLQDTQCCFSEMIGIIFKVERIEWNGRDAFAALFSRSSIDRHCPRGYISHQGLQALPSAGGIRAAACTTASS
jgi:hypothetical protein